MTLHLAIVRCNCSLWSSCRELQVVKGHFARAESTSFISTTLKYNLNCSLLFLPLPAFLPFKSDHTSIVPTGHLLSAKCLCWKEKRTTVHYLKNCKSALIEWQFISLKSVIMARQQTVILRFALMAETVIRRKQGGLTAKDIWNAGSSTSAFHIYIHIGNVFFRSCWLYYLPINLKSS